MTGNADVRDRNASVVVVGHFNPLIFQPEWMRDHDLVGQKEAEQARDGGISIIHPQVVQIRLSALMLEVTQSRFSIMATEAPLVTAKDFAIRAFDLLSHTPITHVGINFTTVFRARSRKDWDALGDTLAPKRPWEAMLGDMATERTGGLIGLVMQRSERPDDYRGSQNVKVEVVPPHSAMDTLVEFNDHYEIAATDARAGMLTELLETQWDRSEQTAARITDGLMELCRAA